MSPDAGPSLLQPAVADCGSLNPAGAPPTKPENLFRRTEPALSTAAHMYILEKSGLYATWLRNFVRTRAASSSSWTEPATRDANCLRWLRPRIACSLISARRSAPPLRCGRGSGDARHSLGTKALPITESA